MIGIYHSRDLDGWASGAIMKLKYPDIKLIGYDYGQPFPWEEIPQGGSVIMADVSLPMEDMIKLDKKCGDRGFLWIDHHISAIKDYKQYPFAGNKFAAFLDNTISACEAVWNYLFPDKLMPEAIKLLGEYDTWRNQDPDRWEAQILPFQFGMRNICSSPETFPYYLLDGDKGELNDVMIYGKVILKYQSQMNQAQCKRSFEAQSFGLRAICHNAGGFNSDLFKSVYDENKHDLMVMFQYDGKNRVWVISLYSTKPEVDCSILAKHMGGGGHKGAAGFQVEHLSEFFPTNTYFEKQKANV